jgi:hypothetical protein
MSLPYTVKSSPKTVPISASGLNENFQYLDEKPIDEVPPPPPDPSAVFVLASRGGFLFWVATEEC